MVKNKGYIFILVRDNKTRNLEWVLLNPYAKKIVSTGVCPFKAFTTQDVSPAGNNALVYAKYPTSLWHLNLDTKEWKQIYKNPVKGQKGLAILPISPIAFVESSRAFSLLDMWDAEHFVIGTFVSLFIPETQKVEGLVTLSSLTSTSIKKIFDKTPANTAFQSGIMRFAEDKSFVYILQSRAKKKKANFKDYLFTYSAGKVDLIDQAEGKIMPLDFKTSPNKLLYLSANKGKSTVYFVEGDKKEPVLEAKALVGRIMNNNLLGIGAIDGKLLNLYLGTPNGKMKKAATFAKLYQIGFVSDGSRVILANPDEIVSYKIVNGK
jgi:hypothetical protein